MPVAEKTTLQKARKSGKIDDFIIISGGEVEVEIRSDLLESMRTEG